VELDNMSNGFVEEYQWLFPGGRPDTSQAEHPTVTYDSAGVYSITLIAYNANGSNQFTLQNAIRVIGPPTATFAVSSQSDFSYEFDSEVTGEEITGLEWHFGDGRTSTEENPSHTYEADGQYEVLLIVSNICGTDTARQLIEIVTTSINQGFESAHELLVYPNPARDRVNISPWPSDAQIEIHNNLGAIQQVWPADYRGQFISVSQLPAGMYFLHIVKSSDRLVLPLVIQR